MDEIFDTIMVEPNNQVISDETNDEQETFSFHEKEDSDIPPSLRSYFETSKSRAEVCEKLILDEFEEFPASHHTEDMMNLPFELDKDVIKGNDRVICDTENKENNTSTDTFLLPAPTETEALFTLSVSVCPNSEDEYTDSEKQLALQYETEREQRHCEEMKREEQRRQIERDFQEELKKIMETEKLHQRELELMGKRAQEKLEQELLLQQELISNLKRRVVEERRMREEEQKRIKDEEDKRRREEEKTKMEAERKRTEQKVRRKKEEERRTEEIKLKKEEEERRKREEEQKRIKDEEDKRRGEEEKIKIEAEKRRIEDEMMRKKEEKRKIEEMKLKKEEEEKRMRKEEERRMKDENDKRKRDGEKIKIETERKRMEEEVRRKKEKEIKVKEEEEKNRKMEREENMKREEERSRVDLENRRLEDEIKIKEEVERKKKEELKSLKKEEELKRGDERKQLEDARKKMEKEKRKIEIDSLKEEEERKKKEEENMSIAEEVKITKEIEEKRKQEEMRKEQREKEALEKKDRKTRKTEGREHGHVDEEVTLKERAEEEKGLRKREKERKKMEEKKELKEVVREKETGNGTMKGEPRPIEEDERRKKEYEKKTKEEQQVRRQKEDKRQEDDEDYRKSEDEITLKDAKKAFKGYDMDNRKMEHEGQTEDKEKKQDDVEKKHAKEEESKREEAERGLKKEEVEENEKEVTRKTEGVRLKEKVDSKRRVVQGREKETRVVDQLQEKRQNNSMMGQNKNNNPDETENTIASHLEDSPTWTSSTTAPSHSESTISPTGTEPRPQQHDPEENISQISAGETVDLEKNKAAKPSTVSVFLPVCLPEHTEKKRLSWIRECIPWSKLSLRKGRKQKGSVWGPRGLRRAAEASSLPPLCPDFLLQSTAWKSLQEVMTVTLENLPGCNLSTLAQCSELRSLTLRRCGLKSLEGIKFLPQLCYIDAQENDISFLDCENMTSLRVLKLAHNKLTSIHGLTGAENLDVLDLSHNSITRIAGLESVRRLQKLSVDHNQLINTKGLRDVYTLLHLNCSHNHLASVEGLENSALLNTLDLRANSLTEPPSLNNQVLLRELHLDDNSVSSLQGLTECWLPLLQHLSVAQNRITQLPSMSDYVSLANLDLRFNCLSEIQNVCESVEGCHFLQEVRLTGNPLQQESSWRYTLQKAVPGLRAIDDKETDFSLMPPAVQQVSSASGSYLMFCQTQLQQTHDLLQQHSRELSNASSSLDALKTSCRHFTEGLQLAEDQRFAHEYGDITVAEKHRAAGQTTPEKTLDMDSTDATKCTEGPEMESNRKVPPVVPHRNRCSHWTFEEESAAESRFNAFNADTTDPKTRPTVSKASSGSVHSFATKGKMSSSYLKKAPVSNHQDLDLQNKAAVVIQQQWRKYRQKCGNSSSPSTAEKGGGRGGDGGEPESGPSYINGSVVGKDHAATVIQACWRGFTLRRRLASALAAVTCSDSGEDDTLEEVDVDEFVFDEAALVKHWTLTLSEDLPPRRFPVSEQQQSFKPPVYFPEFSQYVLPPPIVWRPKEAWMPGEPVDSAGQRVSPENSNRGKSPASPSVLSGLSERSDKILQEWGFTDSHTALLMLKRAQKMKPTKQQQNKRRDPSVCLALFKNCSYQLGPAEAQNRPAQHNRNYRKVREAELGLRQAEKVERVKQGRAQQWLHTQAAQSDRDSESAHFLPEISSDVLNGGRVQLVADPGYTDRLHHARGLWANNSLAAQPCKENNYSRRNSLGHARKEVPSPQRVSSAPLKKERISFRDNPVQLSGGWGGGKKRDKVYK